MAHMKHESGTLIYVEEIGCSTGRANCDYRSESSIFPLKDGQKYYGRGPFQLSWNYNYGQFSTFAFNGGLNDMDILLENPDMVASDGRLAFMSALWFYMYPQSPKPSMHDAILGFFEPNQFDEAAGICTECFGSTTNIINGGLECGYDSYQSNLRIEYYDDYCSIFDADCPQDGKTCANQSNAFPSNGAGGNFMWLT